MKAVEAAGIHDNGRKTKKRGITTETVRQLFGVAAKQIDMPANLSATKGSFTKKRVRFNVDFDGEAGDTQSNVATSAVSVFALMGMKNVKHVRASPDEAKSNQPYGPRDWIDNSLARSESK
eukprot:g8516.t1